MKEALEYHNRTKHSYESVRQGGHRLDWSNQPIPFKVYKDLPPIPLPLRDPTGVPALRAISEPLAAPRRDSPTPADLGHLLRYSAGITKRRGQFQFRAAACTGALYEIELYLVDASGVYQFHAADGALRQLRAGDYRGAVARAAAARAPAFVISTGTYWRNAWKYRDRTYRHFGWDNGTILANLLAMASALGIPARLMCAFVDAEINRLLDLDEHREVALSVVALGENGEPPPAPEIAPLGLETAPLSPRVLDFPLMREVHRASSLATLDEVIAWRAESTAAAPLPKLGGDGVEDVIERRGSARRFDRAPIGLDQLSTMLDRATRGIPADFDGPLNELYLIVHVVDGLPPGAYHYRPAERALDLLKHGEFRRQAAYLALEQDLAGDAAAAVFFLADLDRWLGRFSNRGYRAVQLEAGIAGGKLYLGAYAQRLGATGLTFYDDEVVEFFSPHAAGKSAIFLVAVGRPLRRATAL